MGTRAPRITLTCYGSGDCTPNKDGCHRMDRKQARNARYFTPVDPAEAIAQIDNLFTADPRLCNLPRPAPWIHPELGQAFATESFVLLEPCSHLVDQDTEHVPLCAKAFKKKGVSTYWDKHHRSRTSPSMSTPAPARKRGQVLHFSVS